MSVNGRSGRMMNHYICCIAFLIVIGALDVCSAIAQDDSTSASAPPETWVDSVAFTGEVLPVFYTRDLTTSVDFYVHKLGFVCDHYYDHINGGSVKEWTYSDPPIYAEMRAGDFRFALHQASEPDSLVVGGMRHYFSVADVRAHHRMAKANGVDVGEIVERSWMNMYRVVDPDGHVLYIFTRPPDWEG